MNTSKHLIGICFTVLLLLVELTLLNGQVVLSNSNENNSTTELEQSIHRYVMHNYNRIKPYLEEAYKKYPSLPKGVLEAVSYTYTRFSQMSSDTLESEVTAIPRTYSVMGLTLKGKGVFRENLRLVSALSGFSLESLVRDDRTAILAYALAFSKLQQKYGCYGAELEIYCPIFVSLAELPCEEELYSKRDFSMVDLKGSMKMFPLLSSMYALYSFLADTNMRCFGSPCVPVDFEKLFGANLLFLRKSVINVSPISNEKSGVSVQSDYSGAIWCPAASCNYAIGRSLAPSNVVVHYTSGTYAGSIAWFQNCQASSSAHYVIRSMDGQVTQMVSEADRAWHVGNENGYTIGIEHEAYGNVYSYFTPAMYQASANLVRDICLRRPNILPTRAFYRDTLDDGTVLNNGLHNLGGSSACPQIRGHQHYPLQTHTDPGPYWNWNYYYKLINPTIINETLTDISGILADSGGEIGNYSDNERRMIWIHVDDADSIVLNFMDFDLEADYDFMWIYRGNSPFATLLGRWNTHSPGRLNVSGEDVLIEFRSDCAGTGRGWLAQWQAYPATPQIPDEENPSTQICWNEDDWLTGNVNLHFKDTDDVNVKYSFYQIIERPNAEWHADSDMGCVCDNFDYSLDSSWWSNDGNWRVENGTLRQQNANSYLSVVTARCNGAVSPVYLFDFYLSMDEGNKCSFFFDANALMPTSSSFCGYSVEFDRLNHTMSVYKINNGDSSLLHKRTGVYYTSGQQYLYRICWDKQNRTIKVFRHASMLLSVNDSDEALLPDGYYIGFSTNNTIVSIDNLRSYITRTDAVLLTVGADSEAIIHTQARNGTANCKVKSIVMDSSDKFSPLVEKMLKVDYTPPTCPTNVIDGLDMDVDVITTSNLITASWNASEDGESGIASYLYELLINDKGALPRSVSGRVNVPNTSLRTSLKQTYPSRVVVKVKAKDNAGLESEYSSSDGVLYVGSSPSLRDNLAITPNPTSTSKIILKNWESGGCVECGDVKPTVSLYDVNGRLVKRQLLDTKGEVTLDDCPKGLYVLSVEIDNRILWTGKLVKE